MLEKMKGFGPILMNCGFIFLMFLVSNGCRSTAFNPSVYTENMLTIGEGGGITGIETRYFFTKKGDVFRQTGQDTTLIRMPAIDRKIMTQAIGMAQQLDLINYSYQNPGNVYKFLTVKLDQKESRIVWGSSNDGVKSACVDIYQLLHQSLQNAQSNE